MPTRRLAMVAALLALLGLLLGGCVAQSEVDQAVAENERIRDQMQEIEQHLPVIQEVQADTSRLEEATAALRLQVQDLRKRAGEPPLEPFEPSPKAEEESPPAQGGAEAGPAR